MKNNINMKRILITGGTGFLGAHILKRILEYVHCEHIVLITTGIKPNNTFAYLNIKCNDKLNIINGDIRDFDFICRLFNEYEFDTVFHLAAISEVRKCQPLPKYAFDVNVCGTLNILEACRIYIKRINAVIVSTSDKAYGSGVLPYKEDNSLCGKGIYEVSKSVADMIAQSYHTNYNVPVCIIRCCNLFGPGDKNMSRIIPNNLSKIFNNIPPIIWKGSENYTREFIYITDVVDACLSLIDNINTTKGEAFNIGSGNVISIKKVVTSILKLSKTNILESEIIYEKKDDFPEIPHQYLDSSKIKKYTGWEAKISFEDGIKLIIQEMNKHI